MYQLLLADDDIDDCLFFQEALDDLSLTTNLTTVNDGVQLMDFLNTQINKLPYALFLDLNMPRKSGFECLAEIKQNKILKELPVVIISTSMDTEVVDTLYQKGANYYIRKPGDFNVLKKVIEEATTRLSHTKKKQPERADFIIQT